MSYYSTPVKSFTLCRNRYTRTDSVGEFAHTGDGSTTANIGVNETKTRASNPNYKAQIARHTEAGRGYQRTIAEYTPLFINATAWGYPVAGNKAIRFDAYCKGSVYTDPSVFIDNSADANLSAVALQRLKGRVKSASAQANALVPLVELRELRQTVSSLANATSSVLLAALTLRSTRGASAAKAIANLWLTWSFGIKPMVNDVQSISNAINDMINGGERNVQLSGTASKSWASSSRNVSGVAPYLCNFSGRAQIYHTLSYRYYAGLNLNVRSANNYGVGSQLGLNLQGIPSVLWELTAFSWMWDYFTNVGAYLDDTFTTDANQTVYCGVSRRYEMEATLSGSITAAVSNSFPVATEVVDGHFRYVDFTRTSLGSIPTTQLRIKSVDEIGKSGFNKLANLASVYAGHLKGFTPRGPFR